MTCSSHAARYKNSSCSYTTYAIATKMFLSFSLSSRFSAVSIYKAFLVRDQFFAVEGEDVARGRKGASRERER